MLDQVKEIIMSRMRENNGGVGIGAVVLVVFIVLKLVGAIDWSWWWVLSPFWIGLAVIVAGIVLLGVIKSLK